MSRETEVSSHRAVWLMLIIAIAAGVFAYWFKHSHDS
jgi:hypothetical protein